MSNLERAKALAMNAHHGQTRRNGGPYIIHPERVANSLKDLKSKIVAWLHDVVEDTDVTLYQIRTLFDDEIADAVDSVTERKGEDYLHFILRASKNEIGLKVKIADIKDNLNDDPRPGSKNKYLLALYILEGLSNE